MEYFLHGWYSVANFCSSSDTIWWKGTIWNLGASVSAVMAVFGPQTAKGVGSKVYQSGWTGAQTRSQFQQIGKISALVNMVSYRDTQCS